MTIKEAHRIFRRKCDFYQANSIDSFINEAQLAYYDKLVEDSFVNGEYEASRIMDSDLSSLVELIYLTPVNIGNRTSFSTTTSLRLDSTLATPRPTTASPINIVLQVNFYTQSNVVIRGTKSYNMEADDPFKRKSLIQRSYTLNKDSITAYSGSTGLSACEVRALVLPREVDYATDTTLNWSRNTALRIVDYAANIALSRLNDPSLEPQKQVKDKQKM